MNEKDRITTHSMLSKALEVLYVLNESYCQEPERYLKLTEIMDRMAERLQKRNYPNDYDVSELQHKFARQFRRYIFDINQSGIAHVENKTGKKGGYRLTKNVPTLNLFSEEECTMLSLTLAKSDLVADLKKKPSISSRLNAELVKGGYSMSPDVLYGLMDTLDAINKGVKLELVNYKSAKLSIPSLIITPVAVRLFKGTYYIIGIPKSQPSKDPFHQYRPERAESIVVLSKTPGDPFDKKEVDDYIDAEAFGMHREEKRETIRIKVDKYERYRLEDCLDHKAQGPEILDGDHYLYTVVAYGQNEVKSYLSPLISSGKAEILDK